MFSFEFVFIPPSRHEVPVIVGIDRVSGEVFWIVLVVGGGQVNDGGVVFVLLVGLLGGRVHVAVE